MLNPETVGDRFRRSSASYAAAAAVQDRMGEELLTALTCALGRNHYDRVLELGCGEGLLTRKFLTSFEFDTLFLNDLYRMDPPLFGAEFLEGSAETIVFPPGLDLVISNAFWQWVEDRPALLKKTAGALNADGVLALTTFGPENLREVRTLSGAGLHYPASAELCAEIEREFELLAVHEELCEYDFSDPEAVLRHLKATGVNATGAGQTWTKRRLRAFMLAYGERFVSEHGGVTLTYHPIRLIARKR